MSALQPKETTRLLPVDHLHSLWIQCKCSAAKNFSLSQSTLTSWHCRQCGKDVLTDPETGETVNAFLRFIGKAQTVNRKRLSVQLVFAVPAVNATPLQGRA